MKFVIQRVNNADVTVDNKIVGSPDAANELYEKFIELCRERIPKVETGIFGADMKVRLENDGPFTIVLDSRDFT